MTLWLQRHPGEHLAGAAASSTYCANTCPKPCKQAPNALDCTGTDPGQQGCNDASTNQDLFEGTLFGFVAFFVDNRWSVECQSNWTRTWNNDPSYFVNCGCGGPYYMGALAEYGNGSQWMWYENLVTYGTIWTSMLYGGPGTPCVWSSEGGQSAKTRCF